MTVIALHLEPLLHFMHCQYYSSPRTAHQHPGKETPIAGTGMLGTMRSQSMGFGEGLGAIGTNHSSSAACMNHPYYQTL